MSDSEYRLAADRRSALLEKAWPTPPPVPPSATLPPSQIGMITFLISEAAFFSTLILAYVIFIGQSRNGPYPQEVLSLPLAIGTTFLLLLSSGTVHLADWALQKGNRRLFLLCWSATIALGAGFLLGTAYEWRELIGTHGLTISRNLFGTTYYTLVGFHAAHVSIGVFVMLVLLGLVLRGQVSAKNHGAVQLTSWYWHFVDGVWLVVFSVVYVLGR